MEGKKDIKQAVILAAGEREDFDRPAVFLEIEEKTIIERLIDLLKEKGIEKIVIVVGYESQYFENLDISGLKLVYSDRYKWTGTMESLALVEDYIDEDFLLIEGDLVFEERAIDYLLGTESDNCLVIVNESGSGAEALVETRNGKIFRITKDIHQLSKIDGEFIGLSKISIAAYKDMLLDLQYSQNPYLHYEYVLMNVRGKHEINYAKIDKLVWTELDSQKHYDNLRYYIYPKLKRMEMEFKEKYIKELCSDIMGEEYLITKPIEKLGGMNNNNYKIRTNIKDLVFRLPGRGSNESVDRQSELANAKVAYQMGLDCKMVYFDEESGLKITEYIKDAETLNITTGKRENNMESMAYGLNILHNSGKRFHKDFDPFGEIEDYKETIVREDKKLLEDYKDLDQVVNYLEDQLEKMKIEYVPCHLDAWPENFVKSGDKIYLIDWEYSSNYDKLWDVVSIGLECEYSKNEEELFFNKYFGRKPSEDEMAKMNILRILMDVYWSMWSLAKVSCGENDLYEYSIGRYNRGIVNLNKLK